MSGVTGPVVLVGAGVATASAAEGLREGDFTGDIVLIGDEPHAPYERPPLSKEFLAGTAGPDGFRVRPEEWYAEQGIDLRLGVRAERIDTVAKTVTLADGSVLDYGTLVIGTGARPRVLPGIEGRHVHLLRSLDDARRLDSVLRPGRRIGVLGGGFVGCEIAAAAVTRGAEVTVLNATPLPMGPLGEEIGTAMMAVHREHGVDFRCGVTVTSARETADGMELVTDDGDTVTCDDLVVGVGSVPNVELAADAGIVVDGGVVTDEFGRTSAPDVYAVGDVSARLHAGYGQRIRVEHHDTAMRHGRNLAANLLGETVPFTEQHYFWSDQYDHKLQSIGHWSGDGGEQVLRGSVEDRSFTIFTLVDGQVRSVVTMDRPGDLLQARKLLGQPHTATAAQLADDTFPIKRLLPRRGSRRPAEVGQS
jgi:3-phenylpropionate/trans-cinnamate dioxygenase ferredoxin reductase subunit